MAEAGTAKKESLTGVDRAAGQRLPRRSERQPPAKRRCPLCVELVGAFAGFATGLGWVSMSLAIIYLFEQRSLKLWLINAGCQVVTYTLMGALIGGWK